MKKCIASIAMGAIFFGIGITSVAAEEYEIVKGDNLWNIAIENDTTVDYLVEVNNLETTIIQPQQKIIINHKYTVEENDTLSGIAKEYDATVDEIKEWNGLDSNLLVAGQELQVYDISIDPGKKEVVVKNSEVAKTATEEKAVETEAITETTTEATTEKKSEDETISVSATAYTAKCEGCSGITYTGVDLNSNPNAKVIAVDPDVIPLGTEVYVEGYGHAIAADIGSAIQGNRIDIHVPTKQEALDWGRRTVNVTILN
jgi:3D (Asp-Asp-Asp) domain-containing protein